MIPLRLLCAVLSAVAAGSCASTPDNPGAQTPVPAVTKNLVHNVAPVKELGPQTLQPGKCGMFLWTAASPRRFIFFTEAESQQGLILIGDQPARIWQTEASGGIFGEFNTTTKFLTIEGGTSVEVTIEPGELLEDGQRVNSGRIVLTDNEGWQTILPVLGARACMPG